MHGLGGIQRVLILGFVHGIGTAPHHVCEIAKIRHEEQEKCAGIQTSQLPITYAENEQQTRDAHHKGNLYSQRRLMHGRLSHQCHHTEHNQRVYYIASKHAGNRHLIYPLSCRSNGDSGLRRTRAQRYYGKTNHDRRHSKARRQTTGTVHKKICPLREQNKTHYKHQKSQYHIYHIPFLNLLFIYTLRHMIGNACSRRYTFRSQPCNRD